MGASRWDIARLVFVRSLGVTIAGIVAGIPVSIVVAKLTEPLLFGVGVTDPPAFLVAILIVAAIGVLAAWLPAPRQADGARRATE